MSYPEPRYHGEKGEISAIYRPADVEPDLKIGSSAATYIMKGEATGGKYGLYRWDMAPGTPGAALHFHRTLSEAFFILSGVLVCTTARSGRTPSPVTFSTCPKAASTASATPPTNRPRC